MIYLTGDTHFDYDICKLTSKEFPEGKCLTKDDYVIVLGDFGLLWDDHISTRETYWKKWYDDKPWTTLFVAGNHENYWRINNLPQVSMFGNLVGKVSDSIYHLKTNNFYNINNKKILVIGGAESIDKMHRIENISWWKEELMTFQQQEDLFEKIEKNNKVDYVLTHTCPTSIYDKIGFNGLKNSDPTMKILQQVKEQIKFKKWFFGHFHMDEVIDEKFMCLYNSVIKI